MSAGDWRAVPVDALRAWLQDECDRTSLRAVAGRAGLGRPTVTHFLNDPDHHAHPRVRRALALLYLSDGPGVHDAVAGALDVLLSGLAPEDARGARRGLLDAVKDVYRAAEKEPPPWTNGV